MPATTTSDSTDTTEPAPYHDRHAPLLDDDSRTALADAHATLRAWSPDDQQCLATRLDRLPGVFIAAGVVLLALTTLHGHSHLLALAAIPAIYLCNALVSDLLAATHAAAPTLQADLPALDPRADPPVARGAPGLHRLLAARDRHIAGRVVWSPLDPTTDSRWPLAAVGTLLAAPPVLVAVAHVTGADIPPVLRTIATAGGLLFLTATAAYAAALQLAARTGP